MRQKVRKTILYFSFLSLPVTLFYMSPYLIIMGAGTGLIAGSFLLFAAQFLSSLIAGRAFCGWVCPVGGALECAFYASDRRVRGGWKNLIKYFIWVPWLGLIVYLFIRAGGIQGVDPVLGTEKGFSLGRPEAYIIYIPIVLLVAVLSFTAGRRAFCHYLCWMAPFMVLGRKLRNLFSWPALRLTPTPETCISCGKCTRQCPMSLEVQGMVLSGNMHSSECILCGECADGCPEGTITMRFSGEKSR